MLSQITQGLQDELSPAAAFEWHQDELWDANNSFQRIDNLRRLGLNGEIKHSKLMTGWYHLPE